MALLEKLRDLYNEYDMRVVHSMREPDARYELDRDTRDVLERVIDLLDMSHG